MSKIIMSAEAQQKRQKRSTVAYQVIRDAIKARLPELDSLLKATSEQTRRDFKEWFPEYTQNKGDLKE